MAEALFRNLLQQRAINGDWEVASAGVWAYDGNWASEGAIKALRLKGIDLTRHRARSISLAMMRDSDLILVMESSHKEALQAAFPKYSNKVYLLSEMVGMNHDILDPIGGTPADYTDTAVELEQLLMAALPQMEGLIQVSKEDQA